MTDKKLYYLGTGTEFVKTQCKEYKTIEGALKAAAKDESLVVWDENGNIIGYMTDNVPDGALQTITDVFDENGNKVGMVEAEMEMTGNTPENKAEDSQNWSKNDDRENTPSQPENAQNGENIASKNENEEQEGIANEQVGRFHVTVVCNGSLRLRRSASWNNSNECGRASKGQTYIGKRIFMIDGLPMLETVDGMFMSAAAEHVQITRK